MKFVFIYTHRNDTHLVTLMVAARDEAEAHSIVKNYSHNHYKYMCKVDKTIFGGDSGVILNITSDLTVK